MLIKQFWKDYYAKYIPFLETLGSNDEYIQEKLQTSLQQHVNSLPSWNGSKEGSTSKQAIIEVLQDMLAEMKENNDDGEKQDLAAP